MTFSDNQQINIEDSLTVLEDYVKQLENSEINLDQAFDIFERSVHLSKLLKKKLDSFERKIQIIVDDNEEKVNKSDYLEE